MKDMDTSWEIPEKLAADKAEWHLRVAQLHTPECCLNSGD